MAAKKDGIDEWKKLLCRLPSVSDAEIRTSSSGEITEIHILAGDDRSPKQIARDVQSALLAKFKLEVDHKTISVAQIPFPVKRRGFGARVKLAGLDMSFTAEGCATCVRLECDGKAFEGSAHSDLTKQNRYRAISLATVNALNQFLDGIAVIVPKDTTITDVGGQNVILTSMLFRGNEQSLLLVGTCVEDENGGLSVVRATLDAVNRRLSLIK